MEDRKGLSLIEVIVVIFIILLVLAILMPTLNRDPKIVKRVICGTNLKNLGTAMTVYANDYKENYPQLPGTGPWSKELGFSYNLEKPDFSPTGAQCNTARTISASWYLLVRTTDIELKKFVCPASEQKEFTDKNQQKRDIRSLWDFGPEPYKHISYVMHNPYGKHPADYRHSAAFAIAADMSPYFENGDIIENPKETVLQKNTNSHYPYLNQLYNSSYHETKYQNVLYADGHSSLESRPDICVHNDNIYTYWRITTDEKPNELDKRIGQPPTDRSPENDAKSEEDSFLAI